MPTPVSNLGVIDLGLSLALYNQFASYIGNSLPQSQVIIRYPEEVVQREYAEKQGNQVLNFISFYRNVTQFSWARNRSTVGLGNIPLQYQTSSMNAQTLARAIPLDLTYEIIFWHVDKDVINVLIENFFFWIFTTPTLTIDLQNYPTSIYVNMTENPMEDSSTLKNMYQVGKYWCFKNSMRLEAWVPQLDISNGIIHQIIANVWLKTTGLTKGVNLGTITIP